MPKLLANSFWARWFYIERRDRLGDHRFGGAGLSETTRPPVSAGHLETVSSFFRSVLTGTSPSTPSPAGRKRGVLSPGRWRTVVSGSSAVAPLS